MANSLYEICRPTDWADVVGQDAALKQLDRWRQRGQLTGRAVWISGASGTGKTTICRLLAREVADDLCVREYDAKAMTEDSIENEIRSLRHRPLFGQKQARVLILNEAHRLRAGVVKKMLTLLEDEFPDHALVLFTTTSDGEAGSGSV